MNGQLYLIPKKYFIPRTLSADEFLEAQKTKNWVRSDDKKRCGERERGSLGFGVAKSAAKAFSLSLSPCSRRVFSRLLVLVQPHVHPTQAAFSYAHLWQKTRGIFCSGIGKCRAGRPALPPPGQNGLVVVLAYPFPRKKARRMKSLMPSLCLSLKTRRKSGEK